jgi:hypothetical protein
MKTFLKGFKTFNKINENEEMEEPFRLYGRGLNSKQELIKELKSFIEMIYKMRPETAEDFEQMKSDIKSKSDEIKNHPDYLEFKNEGFEFQDQVIKMSDWKDDFDKAVMAFYQKASKKGLV